MAAARSRLDVARLLRAHDLPDPQVDETFVAVLAAQARDAAGTTAAAPPRRTLKLAGAAVAVLASTVGVAVAANQGIFVPPAPQHGPPATTTSDVPAPDPLDDDPAEETEDRAAVPDASEAPAPDEQEKDAPDADEGGVTTDPDDSAPTRRRPGRTGDDSTHGSADGQDSRGDGPADDESGGDRSDDGADDQSDDGPDESESPEPEGSESDEPGTDEGTDSSETSEPEPDETTGSAGVDESGEDAFSG